jgi:hypothetical protein
MLQRARVNKRTDLEESFLGPNEKEISHGRVTWQTD